MERVCDVIRGTICDSMLLRKGTGVNAPVLCLCIC